MPHKKVSFLILEKSDAGRQDVFKKKSDYGKSILNPPKYHDYYLVFERPKKRKGA